MNKQSNSENKKWWDENTMSYKDWDLNEKDRLDDDPKSIIEVNWKYIYTNPFLKNFFTNLENKKQNNYESIQVDGLKEFKSFNYDIPGDISSASFFIVLTLL